MPTKKQLTVQMTWQEGKSEGCREILRYDKKKTEMPHVGYEQLLGFGNLYISLKTYHKKTFKESLVV